MLGKRVEKTKARALLRKARQKENQKESRSPSRMENQTTKVNRRVMEKANQGGSRMTIRATKEKVVSSQVRLAIVVESRSILPVIVGPQLSETFKMIFNNSHISRPCCLLQVQLPVPLQLVAAHGGQQQGQQVTQFRVDRIHEFSPCQGASFDLRGPVSNSSGQGGSVRVAWFFIGDGPNDLSDGSVRAVGEPMPEGSDLCNILLDSGADASIFPSSMSSVGVDSPANRLQDAQGNSIPVDRMKDIEIHLMDQYGRSVVLKETVAVSSQITQPILCFGHLLENGWGVNGREQTLVHGSDVRVPIEMQNKSMSIRGWSRFLREEPHALGPMVIRAVRADVLPDLSDMRTGISMLKVLVRANITIVAFRTQLRSALQWQVTSFEQRRFNGGAWFVLELCEPMSTLIDCSAGFFGYVGDKFIITITTSS